MPKEVDHNERREELLEAVWRVIARDGMEGTTIRGIAKESGWSTGVLAALLRRQGRDHRLGAAAGVRADRNALG